MSRMCYFLTYLMSSMVDPKMSVSDRNDIFGNLPYKNCYFVAKPALIMYCLLSTGITDIRIGYYLLTWYVKLAVLLDLTY